MRIGVVVETLNMFSWGSGLETFEADVVASKYKGLPICPSSSFKGVLRTQAYVAASILEKRGLFIDKYPVCKGINPLMNVATKPCGLCLICRLFGSPGRSLSPLRFTDMYPIAGIEDLDEIFSGGIHRYIESKAGEIGELFRITTYIRLDDSSKTVSEGALFTAEQILPLTLFYGEIELLERSLSLALRDRGDKEITTAYRLLFTSIALLNYASMGRRGLVKLRGIKVDLGESKNIVSRDSFLVDLISRLEVR